MFPIRLEGECRLLPSRTRLFAPVRFGLALVVEATLVDAGTLVLAATVVDSWSLVIAALLVDTWSPEALPHSTAAIV